MSDFEELKVICQEKWDKIIDLKKVLDSDIIRRDVKLLIEKIGNFDNPEPDKYFNNFMEITIDTDNGTLEIIDKSNNSFRWQFELHYDDFMFRMCDIFSYKTYKQDTESVSLMDATDNPEILGKIKKVIAEYDDTIKYFSENTALTHKYKYGYFSHRECKRCEDIFEVNKAVINHEIDERGIGSGIDWDTYRKTPYGDTYKNGKFTILSICDERWIPGLIKEYLRHCLQKEFPGLYD